MTFYIVADLYGCNLRYYHLYPDCSKLHRRPVKEITEPGQLRPCKYCLMAADNEERLRRVAEPSHQP